MAEVVMPRLSDTMEQGTVAKWLKQPGEQVTKGEPLVEIETDKANMVLDAYESGVLERIVVPEGRMVPIGEPIAYIAEARAAGASTAPTAAPAPAPAPVKREERTVESRVGVPVPEGEEAERLKASPIARRIAQEHDVDLSLVSGTGPGGRVTKEDVESFVRGREGGIAGPISAPPSPPAPAQAVPVLPTPPTAPLAAAGRLTPLTRMQATIARRMAESKSSVPHFYCTNEIGMDAAAELRRTLNATLGEEGKIGFNDLVLRAVVLTLRKLPDVNASYHDGQLEYHEQINLGVAVAVPHGLVVPVLRDAGRKSLGELSREAAELIEKTRTNRLAPSEWEGATFTVSNLGMFDVEEFAAIITPPQSAILAVASIKRQPVVVGEEIKIALRMRLTLSADHRVFYGATAAEFLQEMKRLLENPFSLLL